AERSGCVTSDVAHVRFSRTRPPRRGGLPAGAGLRLPGRSLHRRHGAPELRWMDGRFGLEPGVDVGGNRLLYGGVETRRDPVLVVHDHAAEAIDAHALDEVVGALEVPRVLAVVLHEAPDEGQRLLVRVDDAQDVALTHARAGPAADVDLPAAAL